MSGLVLYALDTQCCGGDGQEFRGVLPTVIFSIGRSQ